MTANKLKRESIIPRIDGIMKDVERLRGYAERPLEEFKNDEDLFALSQFYLRQALEGVFHIGEHMLSRLNGGRAAEYKEIARLLGKNKIVEMRFADTKLRTMAGYRNRLTHFYAEITPEEIYNIINNNLDDFNIFLKSVKEVLENPDRFGLE